MDSWGLPSVGIQIAAAARWASGVGGDPANEIEGRICTAALEVFDAIESPLEAVFAAWWTALADTEREVMGPCLMPQYEVALGDTVYRVDFSVGTGNLDLLMDAHYVGLQWPCLAVELDGHEFHERTKDQVARRDARDRALHRDGWSLFHYSGSELYAAPLRCVREAYDFATTQERELLGRVRAHEQTNGSRA